MLVFWKEKLVILAVPKTGTTALAQALGPSADIVINEPPELKHAPLYRYNRFFRPMFAKACKEDGLEIMAIMREPVSWLSSWYRYRQRAFLNGKPTSTAGLTFDEFVEEYCQVEKASFAKVGSQAKFLEPRENGTKVNHLFAYEDYDRATDFLSERLQRPVILPTSNKSPVGDMELSEPVESKLRETYPEDFALYQDVMAKARP